MALFPFLLQLADLTTGASPEPGDLASADCAWYGLNVASREWWYTRPDGEYRVRAVQTADGNFDAEVIQHQPNAPIATARVRTRCDQGGWLLGAASFGDLKLKESVPVCTRTPPRLVAGASWTCSFSWALESRRAATVGGHATWLTEVSDGGVVETPAGSWPTLLVVSTPVDAPGRAYRTWLAKDVGPVKIDDSVLTAVSPGAEAAEQR